MRAATFRCGFDILAEYKAIVMVPFALWTLTEDESISFQSEKKPSV